MTFGRLILKPEDVEPHGLRCVDCDVVMNAGDEYRERLVSLSLMKDDFNEVSEIICVACDEKANGDAPVSG
jgi:hypothetical protein